jgi:hypothetical protein
MDFSIKTPLSKTISHHYTDFLAGVKSGEMLVMALSKKMNLPGASSRVSDIMPQAPLLYPCRKRQGIIGARV